MKIATPRLDYILLIYVPFALVGVLLTYFFLDGVINALKVFMPATGIIAAIAAFTPFAKQKSLSQSTAMATIKTHWLLKLIGLQIGITLIFFGISQAFAQYIIHNSAIDLTTITQATRQFYAGGLWPWPFILLVSAAITYLGQQDSQPALLREAVKPLIKKHADGIIGFGIEIFLKQGLLFSTALALSIIILNIAGIFSHLQALPSLFVLSINTLIIGSLIIIFIPQNPFIQALTRKLHRKNFADNKLILINVCLIVCLLISLNFLTTVLFSAFSQEKQLTTVLTFIPRGASIDHWLLLSACWWFGIMPLLTRAISIIGRDCSLRNLLLGGLLWPILLSIFTNYLLPNFKNLIGSITYWPVALLLGISCLLLSATFFRPPNTCGIANPQKSCNPAIPSTVTSLRMLWQLCTCTLVALLLTNMTFITYFFAALSAPIFATLFSAILGYCISIINRKKKK